MKDLLLFSRLYRESFLYCGRYGKSRQGNRNSRIGKGSALVLDDRVFVYKNKTVVFE
jgi:hypothetical protein